MVARIFKMVLYGLESLSIAVFLVFMALLGGAAGAVWYFTRSPGLQVTARIPYEGKEVMVNITNNEAIPKEVMEKIVREGVVQSTFQVTGGPNQLNLLGMTMFVRVPYQEIISNSLDSALDTASARLLGKGGQPGLVQEASAQLKKELGPLSAFMGGDMSTILARMLPSNDPGQLAVVLFGDDANKTISQFLDSRSPQELRALFGSDYDKVLNTLLGGSPTMTLQQKISQDPSGSWQLLRQALPKEVLDSMTKDLLGEAMDKTYQQLTSPAFSPQAKALFGNNYQAALDEAFQGASNKTLGQVLLEDPFRMLSLLADGKKSLIMESILEGR